METSNNDQGLNDYIYILLGTCCRISNTIINLNLKKKTGLFEWMRSEKFTDILSIVKKVVNNEPVEITSRSELPNDDFLADTEIRSTHCRGNFDEIFKRRSARFLDDIKSNNKIVFIRDDYVYNVTKENIEEFKQYIEKVNPKCKYNILLLSPSDKFNKITTDKLYHELYKEVNYIEYLKQIKFE
jgi:hypothetical protein